MDGLLAVRGAGPDGYVAAVAAGSFPPDCRLRRLSLAEIFATKG